MTTQNHSNPLLTTEEAADVLKNSSRTLIRWRNEGSGPPYCRIGRRIRYKFDSLNSWITEQETTPIREAQ